MPEKTLYVFGLDGTLLGRDDKLSAFTIETLERLVKAGMFFIYATARSFRLSAVVTKGLEVNLLFVVYNGVFILETGTGELLSSSLFHPGDAEATRWIFDRLGVFPLVYSLVAGEEKVSWLPRAEMRGQGVISPTGKMTGGFARWKMKRSCIRALLFTIPALEKNRIYFLFTRRSTPCRRTGVPCSRNCTARSIGVK